MAYWLTTHYPHPWPDTLPWHIYLQHQHRSAVDGIAQEDLVFFYEFAEQKALKDGTKYPRGAQGIVCVATVSGPVYHRDTVIEYADGTTGYWSWGVPTADADFNGFVPREELLKVLGYKPGGRLRGFNSGQGVMPLDNEQGYSLLQLFENGTPITR